MAELKKFLDATGLQKYDTKIKEHIDSKDAATLAASKSYSDSKDSMFDPAGSAVTAKTEAVESSKAYTDGKITEVNGAIDGVKKTAEQGVTDAAVAKHAADAADAKISSLKTYVGTLPEDTEATTVVEYINKKTEGIASDAALQELQTAVTKNTGDIATIKGDYLKAADKTELQTSIKTVDDKIGVLNGTGAGSVKKQVDDAINKFATDVTNDGVVNTFKELVDYCATHGSEAAEMAGDIDKNKQAIATLETYVGKLPESTQAADVIAYINEKVATEQSRAEGAEAGLGGRITTLEGKFGSGEGTVEAQIEAAKQAAISTASADATSKADKAKKDAVTEANAHTDAEIGKVKTAADELGAKVTTAEGKITALEDKAHTHANAEVLNGITAQKVAGWDVASTNQHVHTNKTALDLIDEGKITAWSNSETNAKSYSDSLFASFVPVTAEEIDNLFKTA